MLTQITPNIYISDFDSNNDRPRLGYIKGSKFNIMIDAGNSPAHFKSFIIDCNSLDLKEPDFILLTHWHWDHVFGLTGTSIPAICSSLTQDKLVEMSQWKWDDLSMKRRLETNEDIEFCDINMRIEYANPLDIKIRKADIFFDTDLTIDLGDRTCIIKKIDNDHALDSSVIYIPEEKVLFLGDIISPDYHHGDAHYTKLKYDNLITELFKFDFELAVHGHTEVFTRETLRLFFENPEAIVKESFI
jgi:glyoxylase-like metal-dependent hydrolase (beta-lactamase superfamily II)